MLFRKRPIFTEIWVAKEAFNNTEDNEPIVLSAGEFLQFAMDECLLKEGEFPVEALRTYWVDNYLGQVTNGGHLQFAINSEDVRKEAMKHTEGGLKAMEATVQLDAFRKFKKAMKRSDVAFLIEAGDFNPPDDVFELDNLVHWDELRSKNATWLRTLPNLRLLPLAKLQEEKRSYLERERLAIEARKAKLMKRSRR